MNDIQFFQKINYDLGTLGIEFKFDSKSEIIDSCKIINSKNPIFANFLEHFSVGKSLLELRDISKISALKNTHTDPNISIPLYVSEVVLIDRAIDDYFGKNVKINISDDLLCACFNLSYNKLKKLIISNPLFDLKKLVSETHASSACTICLPSIKNSFDKIKKENGILDGSKNSRAKKNAKGEWIKIVGLYPIDFLIEIDSLKNEWLKLNDLEGKIHIDILKHEGLHFHISIDVEDEFKKKLLIEALADYVMDKLGILIFFDF